MTTARFGIKISRSSPLIMTPRDLLDLYLYGITTKAQDGSTISNETYINYIRFAQAELENYLGIKLTRQIIEEDISFIREDVRAWNMLSVSYPVEEPVSLIGYYGEQKHITMPKGWLSSKKSSDDVHHRSVHVVPNGAGQGSAHPFIYGALSPFLGFGQADVVPNYWRIQYITGFKRRFPYEVYDLVGKLAAVNLFNVLGDIILGAGIASQSIGIDGLSQSIATTSSATNSGYGARVTQYLDELRKKLPQLRDFYTGIRFTCV